MLVGRGKELKVAAMNGMQLSALEKLGAKVKGDETFKQKMDRIREAAKQTFAVPANIHAELRPYQQTGYEWMSCLAYWGAGACLADDMGLGKTLQAIANLETGTKSTLQTLAEITRLRQAACHPRLIDPKLPIASSKTQAFLDLVEELRQSGHRALVFGQFTSHLALICEALDKQYSDRQSNHSPLPRRGAGGEASGGEAYLYLDGSTSAVERNRLVRQFQTGDQPLFLISLKAGGLGLNLTAADYVIHLDPWWNPAVEDQASDSAHRIGQERPVTVYRLIAAGTIEEKIIRLHQNKRSMADALLQDADMLAQISADDVIKLLCESVYAIGEGE